MIYLGGSRVPGVTRGVSPDAESGHGNSRRAYGRCGAVGSARDRVERRARSRTCFRPGDGGPSRLQQGGHRARSTNSNGMLGPRKSRTSAAGSSSSRLTARFLVLGANLPTNVVASKYFYGDVASGNGSPATGNREYSVRQLIDRVTRTIADWGKDDGYFATADDADRFYDELTVAVPATSTARSIRRSGSTWVFFTATGFQGRRTTGDGTTKPAQSPRPPAPTSIRRHRRASSRASATTWKASCALATSEAMLFKFGSGTGTDLSTLALQPRKALRRRQAIGPGQLHAGL